MKIDEYQFSLMNVDKTGTFGSNHDCQVDYFKKMKKYYR